MVRLVITNGKCLEPRYWSEKELKSAMRRNNVVRTIFGTVTGALCVIESGMIASIFVKPQYTPVAIFGSIGMGIAIGGMGRTTSTQNMIQDIYKSALRNKSKPSENDQNVMKMATKFKQVVGTVALASAVALGASACGQFAPTNDVSSVASAVKQGIIAQNKGNASQDCTFSAGGSKVMGTEEKWNKAEDSGYACIGPRSTDNVLYYDITHGGNANNKLPFYPAAYFNTIGNNPEQITYGVAAVISPNKVAVQISDNNGMNFMEIQTIAVVTIPGVYNPFTEAVRK